MMPGTSEHSRGIADLARAIQAATGEPYELSLPQAHSLVASNRNSLRCNAQSGEYVCHLRIGPHVGWMHFDEKSGVWWQQSHAYPFRSVTAVDEVRMEREAKATTEVHALEDQVAEARMWARHGYEIGQRSCTWSDFGVAPAWLTGGWGPGAFKAEGS